MIRSRRWTIAVAAAGLAVTGLVGCSTSTTVTSPTASPSPTGPQTYTDEQFGFSFDYEPPFAPDAGAVFNTQSGPPPAAMVSVSDPKGPTGEAGPVNSWTVSVYELGEPVTAANLPAAKSELEQRVLPALQQGKAKLGELKPTTVAGAPAFTVDGSFAIGKTPVSTTLTFVLDGNTEYQIVAQNSTDTAKQTEPVYAKMLASFRIPPAPSPSGSAAPSGATASTGPTGAPAAPSTSPS
jgi:hypothetical protein